MFFLIQHFHNLFDDKIFIFFFLLFFSLQFLITWYWLWETSVWETHSGRSRSLLRVFVQAQAVGSLRWDYNRAGGDKAVVTCYEWTKWFPKTSGQARQRAVAQIASAKSFYRAPLLAQWLRNHLAMQGTLVRYLVRKIPSASGQLNLCATTTEPVL